MANWPASQRSTHAYNNVLPVTLVRRIWRFAACREPELTLANCMQISDKEVTMPTSTRSLVDGDMVSWYGSRATRGFTVFAQVRIYILVAPPRTGTATD